MGTPLPEKLWHTKIATVKVTPITRERGDRPQLLSIRISSMSARSQHSTSGMSVRHGAVPHGWSTVRLLSQLLTMGVHMNDRDKFAWADAYLGQGPVLGEIFCLTFIKQVDVTEALRRMGGLFDTIARRTPSQIEELHNFDDGYPEVAAAVPLGDWTLVVEPNRFHGSHLVAALSSGTEAVSVLRHDYATPWFAYAVGGDVVTRFDPTFPAFRHGSDPDRLLPQMLEVGFTIDDEEDDDMFDNDTARSLRLAERLTGAVPTIDVLTGPLTSVYFEHWFSQARKPPATRSDHSGRVEAIDEVRRLATLHDLADTPGLEDALTTAATTKPVHVTPESQLGRHVRAWLTESRRASSSLNDHGGRSRMTEAQRQRGYDLGGLAVALGAALQPDLDPAD
jgi:hypothetical protein